MGIKDQFLLQLHTSYQIRSMDKLALKVKFGARLCVNVCEGSSWFLGQISMNMFLVSAESSC